MPRRRPRNNPPPPGGGVQRNAAARGAAADDEHVERLHWRATLGRLRGGQALQLLRAGRHVGGEHDLGAAVAAGGLQQDAAARAQAQHAQPRRDLAAQHGAVAAALRLLRCHAALLLALTTTRRFCCCCTRVPMAAACGAALSGVARTPRPR
jgi:hypothetical protein